MTGNEFLDRWIPKGTWTITIICLVQMLYLLYGLWIQPYPSLSAELTFQENKLGYYLTFTIPLAISVSLLWFPAVLKRCLGPSMTAEEKRDLVVTSLAFYLLGSLMVITFQLLGGRTSPAVEAFVDLPNETLVSRQVAPLPRGIDNHTVPFAEVTAVKGAFYSCDPEPGWCYHLVALTKVGKDIPLGHGTPHFGPRSGLSEPDPASISLAESIAAKSGAELNLTTRVVED